MGPLSSRGCFYEGADTGHFCLLPWHGVGLQQSPTGWAGAGEGDVVACLQNEGSNLRSTRKDGKEIDTSA